MVVWILIPTTTTTTTTTTNDWKEDTQKIWLPCILKIKAGEKYSSVYDTAIPVLLYNDNTKKRLKNDKWQIECTVTKILYYYYV